jgi:uncharacterized membrane protein YfcA
LENQVFSLLEIFGTQSEWWIFPAAGLLAGLLAGCFGIGGGLVFVPVMVWVFSMMDVGDSVLMHLAIGTSLATIVPTSLSSIYAHHRRDAVQWAVFAKLVPGILAGGLAGAALANELDFPQLKTLFSSLLLIIAVYILVDRKPVGHRTLPGRVWMTAAGIGIGTVSALGGIGGGVLTNPYLLWCSVGIRQSVATAAACTLPVALAGSTGFILTGLHAEGLPQFSSGYVYWPAVAGMAVASLFGAPLGAAIAHNVPTAGLRRALAVLLMIVGVKILFT